MKAHLSVNINKVALLRNSRTHNLPNLLDFARDCERYGADGITVHPRPDERHVRYDDLRPLKEFVETELNIEGYPNEKFMNLVLDIKPTQCTLVPDDPSQLTSDHGWNPKEHYDFLNPRIEALKYAGIRVSLFLDPVPKYCEYVKCLGADRIELYTGPYAENFHSDPSRAIESYKITAIKAHKLGLGINAGHDLNLDNLSYFSHNIPHLLEVSIGHALICDALYYGIQNSIGFYQNCLRYS